MAEETENPESLAEINTEPLEANSETNDIRETFDKPLWMYVNPDLNLSEEEILALHREGLEHMEEEEVDPYDADAGKVEPPPDLSKATFGVEAPPEEDEEPPPAEKEHE